MASHFANDLPPHLLMWQRVREYAVPPSMIETATARRAAGDWAGACAAARVDADLDLRAVRDRHGTELTTRLRADLRRLAPDLLRWHMPRIAPDGRLRPGLTIPLAQYGGYGDGPSVQLVVRTPPARADAGQRMSLSLWEGPGDSTWGHHPHPHPDRRFRLDLHRHLWDRTRSGELARRCGSPDQDSPWAKGSWAAEAELLLRTERRPRGAFTVRLGARGRAVLELVAPDDSHAPTFRPLPYDLPPQEAAALPVLPEAAARLLPDLELLRSGLITVGRLHPLVAEALPAVRERLGHGDVSGALAVVEGLLGPAAMLRDGPLRQELESAAARRVDHGLFRAGLVAVHPAATARRPRLDRHTPAALRSKRGSRPRPRTGLL